MARPVILLGHGRLGSALVQGWLGTGALKPEDLTILARGDSPTLRELSAQGVRVNPGPERLPEDAVWVLAVKPAAWREAVEPWRGRIGPQAVVLSVMAGVSLAETARAFAAPVARVMPATGVAQGRGVASAWAEDERGWIAARDLFRPIADLVELPDEARMDAATAVAGCGPAYVLALARAMARAGEVQGLAAEDADRLARGALRSAAAVLDGDGSLDEMIGRIASPGGVTEAGLKVLAEGGALEDLAARTIDAAVRRAAAT